MRAWLAGCRAYLRARAHWFDVFVALCCAASFALFVDDRVRRGGSLPQELGDELANAPVAVPAERLNATKALRCHS